MKGNVFGRIYKHRRVWAVLAVLLMVVTLLPGEGLSVVNAITGSTELKNYINQTPTIQVYNSTTGRFESVTDPNIIYDGSTIQIDLNYTLPSGLFSDGDWDAVNDKPTENMVFTYPLPGNIKFENASQQDGMKGEITSTSLDGNKAGDYVIEYDDFLDTYVVKITFNREVYEYNTGKDYDAANKTFVDSTSKQAQKIDGDFYFKCEADLGDDQEKVEYQFEGKTGKLNSNVYVVAGSESYDIKTTKGISTRNADGSYTNTVTISTEKGTRGEISASDNLGKYFTLNNGDTITVSGAVSKSYTVGTDVFMSGSSDSGHSFDLGSLPKLAAGQSYTIKYTTYLSDAVKNENNEYLTAENKFTATAKGPNGESSDKDTSTGNAHITVNHSLVKKSGTYNSSDNTITYTVTINEAHENLNGVTIKDVFTNLTGEDINNVTALKNQISVISVTASGGSASPTLTQPALEGSDFFSLDGNGGYTFAADDTNTYTITYKYTLNEPAYDDDRRFTNDAYYNDIKTSTGVDVKGNVYQTKTNGTVSVDEDGLNIAWTITVTNPTATDIPAGSYTEDKFTGNDNNWNNPTAINHYMVTPISPLPKGVSGITYYDKNGSEISDSAVTKDNPAYSVKFTYDAISANNAKTITINYSTFAPFGENSSDIQKDDSKYYYLNNTATYKDVDGNKKDEKQTKAEYQYKANFKKYVIANGNWMHSSSGWESPITYTDGMELEYVIKVYANTEEDLVLTDTLPEGASLSSVNEPVMMKYSWSTETVPGAFTYSYDSTSNKVTFNVSKESRTEDHDLHYYVTIPDEASKGAVDGVQIYTNTVSDGTDSSSVSQKVKYPSNGSDDVLYKGDPDVDSANNTATYSIVVNPDGEDLDPLSNTLELVDKLTIPEDYILGMTVDASDIQVYNYDENAENKRGTSISNYSYSKIDGNASGNEFSTLTFTLPDETPLVVVYTYHFTFSTNSKLDSEGKPYVPITNVASLTGGHNASNSDFQYRVTSSGGSAVTHPTITLFKVSSENFGQYLAGAEFALTRYDETANAFVDSAIASFTLTTDGLKMDSNLSETDAEHKEGNTLYVRPHTIYKLVETKAPDGYTKRDKPVYLVFGNHDSSASKLIAYMKETRKKAGIDNNDIKYVSVNQNYVIPNEPNNSPFVAVNKIWKDAAGEVINVTDVPEDKEVNVELWRVPANAPSHKVTLNIYSYDSNNPEYQNVIYIAKESSVTYKFGCHLDGNKSVEMDIRLSDGRSEKLQEIGINQTVEKTYTIVEDTVIDVILDGGTWQTPMLKGVDYTKPTVGGLITGSTEKVATTTLTKDNAWTYRFENGIDEMDPSGNIYYYYVVETDGEGYITTYDVAITARDNGYPLTYEDSEHKYSIEGGTLSVTNQDAASQKGKLSVTKKISGEYTGTSTFPVTVTLKDGKNNPVSGIIKDSDGNPYTFPSTGAYTFNLGKDKKITLVDIPYGYHYTVTEGTLDETIYSGFVGKEITNGTGIIANEDTEATVTNRYSAPVDISVEKVWDDKIGGTDNALLSRPDKIEVQLYKKVGTASPVAEGDPVSITAGNEWKKTWYTLPTMDSAGNKLSYSVQETGIITGYTLTNTERVGNTISITNTYDKTTWKVLKVWDDGGDTGRPSEIGVTLNAVAGSTTFDDALFTSLGITRTQTLSATGGWTYTWNNLPKYYNKQIITYSVTEADLSTSGYTASYKDDPENRTTTITNKKDTDETSLTVVKKWDDGNNTTNRKDIEVQLYRSVNGGAYEAVDTVNSVAGRQTLTSPDYTYTWSNLLAIDGANKYKYTVREIGTVAGYITPAADSYETDITTNTVTITNTKVADTSLSVKKKWEDNNNQDGKRPDKLKVKLTANAGGTVSDNTLKSAMGVTTLEQDLTSDNDWSYTWENLPAYINGSKVTYNATEPTVPEGYMAGDTERSGSTVTLVNTHETIKTERSVEKVWDNPTGQPAAAQIRVQLTKNGTPVPNTIKVLSAANEWKCTWDELDKYEGGKEILYSVAELDNMPGYGWTVKDKEGDSTKTILQLYNSLPEINTKVTVNKTWVDDDNNDGKRPGSITVNLLADGTPVKTATLNDDNNWSYTWDELLYMTNNPTPKVIDYTVEEDTVEGYDLTKNERTITGPDSNGIYTTTFALENKHEKETTEIEARKKWDDEGYESHRPTITFQLLSRLEDGTVSSVVAGKDQTPTAANDWKVKWEDLPKYSNGEEIIYSVEESRTGLDGYSIFTEVDSNGTYVITNSYPAKRQISVNKEWDDADNQDGIRPTEITVHLEATVGGVDVGTDIVPNDIRTQTLNEANGWKYTWSMLPTKKGIDDINYKVTEDSVTGYTGVVDNTDLAAGGKVTITNTHTPETTDMAVKKVWVNNIDPETIPATIRVSLLANGTVLPGKNITLSATSSPAWEGSWTNLPKYSNGKEIEYTVEEINVPSGYKTTGSLDGTIYTLTNVRTVPVDVTFSKRSITGSKELPGAVLKIVDSVGNTVLDSDGNPIEWTSGNTPYTVKGLEVNAEYTLIEDTAPAGYAVIAKTTFKIDANGKVVLTGGDEHVSTSGDRTVIINDQFTSVKVSKVDITSGDELEGAHIQIIDENGDVVEEWDSKKEPHEITGLITGKKYILRETVAPLGYTITTDTTFMLDKNGKVINDESGVTTATVSGSDSNLLLVEDGLTKLNFTKVGKINETCSANPGTVAPIPGAKFAVYPLDASGNVSDTDAGTATSNSDGVVVFEGLPAGKYAVKEISVPEPYILDTTVYYATVFDSADKNFEGLRDAKDNLLAGNRLVNDQYRADISLLKVSEYNTSEALPNSTYGLYKVDTQGNESLVATNTTDTDGKLTFEGVLTGETYKVREVAPPDGYYVSKNPITISFKVEDGKAVLSAVDNGNGTATIDENGNITWLEPSVVVKFAKTDSKGKMLAGAKLTVKDSDGKVVTGKDGKKLEWKSTKSAYEVEGVFEIGKTYYLVELSAPKGYKKAAQVAFTIPDDTVASNENKIVSVTMVDEKKKSSTTSKSGSSTSKKSGSSTKTGDASPIRYAGILLLISLLAGSLLTVYSYRKRKDD